MIHKLEIECPKHGIKQSCIILGSKIASDSFDTQAKYAKNTTDIQISLFKFTFRGWYLLKRYKAPNGYK